MKYLIITTEIDADLPESVAESIKKMIPGVQVVVITGATSATLIDVPEQSQGPSSE